MEYNTDLLCGFKIKGLRIANKLSPATVAKQLDITPTYLSIIENGKKKPSKKVISKAAKLFNVPEESFFTSTELIENIREIASEAQISDLIQAFELIMKEKNDNEG